MIATYSALRRRPARSPRARRSRQNYPAASRAIWDRSGATPRSADREGSRIAVDLIVILRYGSSTLRTRRSGNLCGVADQANDFLDLLRRRVARLWVIAGALVGIGLIVAWAIAAVIVLGVILVAVGVMVAVSALMGRRMLQRGQDLALLSRRALQMWTYPVSGRGGWTVAVLATFDEVDSTNRTPWAEVRTAWFTPGIAEKPTAVAEVYSTFEPGGYLLAVQENGGIVGKLKIVRA
jgi:hypothetical protein